MATVKWISAIQNIGTLLILCLSIFELHSQEAIKITNVRDVYAAINRGQIHGINKGDRFHVTTPDDTTQFGQIEVIEVRDTVSAVKLISSFSGYSLKVGDLVAFDKDSQRSDGMKRKSYFWITEFGYAQKIYQDAGPSKGKRGWYFTGELGLLGKLSNRAALGGSFMAGADDNGSRFGLKARYRLWLSQDLSLDISPGILIGGSDNSYDAKYPGFIGQVGMNFGSFFGLTMQLEIIPFELRVGRATAGKDEDIILYGGAKLGSGAGIVGALVATIAGFIIVSTAF